MRRFMVFMWLIMASVSANANDWSQKDDERFAEYRERMRVKLLADKTWVNPAAQAQEVEAILPFDRPRDSGCIGPEIGVLMFHGLSDSPMSLRDPANALATRCISTRVMLLPGHGTKAEDLLTVTRDDWRFAVKQAVQAYQQEVDVLYLAGFSTGGALVTEYAWLHPNDVDGVILFSPLFKINSAIDWLSPWLAPFVDWLDHYESDDYAKYASIPVPAIAEAYKLAKEVRETVSHTSANVPVFLALSEQDATVDAKVTTQLFDDVFDKQPRSEAVIYTTAKKTSEHGHYHYVNTQLDEQKILGFSHMAVHGAPDNPYYGQNGEYRICGWYQADEDRYQACRHASDNWFGEKSEALAKRSEVAARLSWNPYFDDLMSRVASFIQP